jgi:hypothetical protein
MNYKLIVTILASIGLLAVQAPAVAVTNLTLQASTSGIGQNNLDCIFHATTCPGGTYGLAEPSNYGNNAGSYTGQSLTYFLGSGGAAGFNLPFNKFDVEIDSASDSALTDRLTSFKVFVGNTLQYEYTYAGLAGNIPGNNGNSNADYKFTGIDLSGFAAGTSVYFEVAMDTLTGGPESIIFFNGTTVTAIPEPSELALLAAGIGLVAWRKRKAKKSSTHLLSS